MTLFIAAVVPANAQSPQPGEAQAMRTAEAPAASEAPHPGYWIDDIHVSVHIEGGITANPTNPGSGVNFGRQFDDRANQPLLNQILLNVNRPLNPKAAGFDWGFKLQGIYGSDARYTHFLGVFDQASGPTTRNQFDILEANVLLHLPVLTEAGIDIRFGMYSSPVGYETSDAAANPFYSHSYIFNFGTPQKHTGILTTTHVNPMLDLYLGIDSGVNTSLGCCHGDNNGSPAGIAGFGLNMMDGNLTLQALTHLGPENPVRGLNSLMPGFNANKYMRYLSDVSLTWRVDPNISLVSEANWIRDDFLGFVQTGKPDTANGYGVAQYFSYAVSDTVTFNARAELWRDDNNVFITTYAGNTDYVRGELGLPPLSPVITSNRPTTYGAITVGLTFKVPVPAPIQGLLIRPELRVDSALNGARPFADRTGAGTASSAMTAASDFILTF